MLSVRFPLLLLVLFPLSLIFVPLITMGLGVFLLRFILHGAFSASWTWVTISFPTLGKFVLAFSWVELYFFSLECNEMSSNEL